MKPIKPVYEPVNICFASNEKYAPHLATAIYSLLKNRDTSRMYDILVLHKEIREKTQKDISMMVKNKNVSIRFISMEQYEREVAYDVGAYYSIETNYRLFLFGEMFAKYDKMLYLDCDLIVEGDISKLYDVDMGDCEAAAVRSEEFRLLSKVKKSIFMDCYPYNIDNYRTDALGMKDPDNYFNAGVLVMDLKKSRQRITQEQIFEILHRHNYKYNDQDVLNIVFDGKVKSIDCCWNYMTYIPEQLKSANENNRKLYEDLYRENPYIIHYTSGKKPWNMDNKVLGDRYWKYRKEMEEKNA
ncbi:MAG: glycosyltransferase family 8 protein [Eubacterium sp.]